MYYGCPRRMHEWAINYSLTIEGNSFGGRSGNLNIEKYFRDGSAK